MFHLVVWGLVAVLLGAGGAVAVLRLIGSGGADDDTAASASSRAAPPSQTHRQRTHHRDTGTTPVEGTPTTTTETTPVEGTPTTTTETPTTSTGAPAAVADSGLPIPGLGVARPFHCSGVLEPVRDSRALGTIILDGGYVLTNSHVVCAMLPSSSAIRPWA